MPHACSDLKRPRRAASLQVPDDSVLLAETGALNAHIEKLEITEASDMVLQSVPLVVTAMYEKMRGAELSLIHI